MTRSAVRVSPSACPPAPAAGSTRSQRTRPRKTLCVPGHRAGGENRWRSVAGIDRRACGTPLSQIATYPVGYPDRPVRARSHGTSRREWATAASRRRSCARRRRPRTHPRTPARRVARRPAARPSRRVPGHPPDRRRSRRARRPAGLDPLRQFGQPVDRLDHLGGRRGRRIPLPPQDPFQGAGVAAAICRRRRLARAGGGEGQLQAQRGPGPPPGGPPVGPGLLRDARRGLGQVGAGKRVVGPPWRASHRRFRPGFVGHAERVRLVGCLTYPGLSLARTHRGRAGLPAGRRGRQAVAGRRAGPARRAICGQRAVCERRRAGGGRVGYRPCLGRGRSRAGERSCGRVRGGGAGRDPAGPRRRRRPAAVPGGAVPGGRYR